MGWRAIRLGLDRPGLLRMQLRALLHAAAGRELRVMLPMVTELDEVGATRAMIERELAHHAPPRPSEPTQLMLGAMVEVPSLLFQLDGAGQGRRFRLGRLQRPLAVHDGERPRQHAGGRPVRSAVAAVPAGAADDRARGRSGEGAGDALRRACRQPAGGDGAHRPRLPLAVDVGGGDRAGQGDDAGARCRQARRACSTRCSTTATPTTACGRRSPPSPRPKAFRLSRMADQAAPAATARRATIDDHVAPRKDQRPRRPHGGASTTACRRRSTARRWSSSAASGPSSSRSTRRSANCARPRASARASTALLADPEMAALAEDEAQAARRADRGAERDGAPAAPPQGRGRREERHPRNPRRHRRRRGGALRRRSLPHVSALRRPAWLEGGGAVGKPGRGRRLQGNHRQCHRQGRVRAAEVRVGRPPRAARAGDRGERAHPHLGGDGRGAAGGRGGRHRHPAGGHPRRYDCAPRAPAASTPTPPIRRCA